MLTTFKMSKWFPEPVMRISLTIVLFMLAGSAYAQPSVVTFCDLLRHADKYNGKEVSLRATYRYGFEWQELFCLDCMDKGKAWLDIPSDLNDASARSLRKAPKGAGIVNLTLQGIFVSGGHFGQHGIPVQNRGARNQRCRNSSEGNEVALRRGENRETMGVRRQQS